jgi:16S rRNA (adenine1518-N6/adenine1519-N6)-dimethyltransferase
VKNKRERAPDPQGAGPQSQFQQLKAALDALGFHPTSSRGQNFLLDANLLDAIVRDAEIGDSDEVVEIGAGPGLLTVRLAAAARRVVAVELDDRLVEWLRTRTAGIANLELVHGDALGHSKHGLHDAIRRELAAGPRVVVGNLPYDIAAPLVLNLFRNAPPPVRGLFLVQKEMAERFAAHGGTDAFGAPSVALQARASVAIVRTVPRTVFRPRPRVESALVRLVPRADRPAEPVLAVLDRLIAIAFANRRKMLLPRLSVEWPEAAQAFHAEGAGATCRAEELPVSLYERVARDLSWISSP